MKKHINKIGIFLLIVLILGLAGCKKQEPGDTIEPVKTPGDSTEDVVDSEEDREKIMEEFETVLGTKEIDKVVDFVNDNIGKLTTVEGDKVVLELEALLEDSIDSLTDKLLSLDKDGKLMELSETELFFPMDKIKDIDDEELRVEVTRLYNSKYKLINLEGQLYPIIDYEAFKEYNKNVSDEIKDYIDIMAEISNEPIAVDAALRISFDELATRILRAENYLQRYAQGQKYEDMLRKYSSWLNIYLQGLPNTPIADHDTRKIKEEVMKSYVETAKVNDSATAFVVTKYIGAINENKGIVNENLIDKSLSLVNEALSSLEASK